jgi:hypothetical protein
MPASGLRRAPLLTLFTLSAASFAFASPQPEMGAEKSKPPAVYRCVGFDEPVNRSPIAVNQGRVLPLRAKLAGENETYADDSVLKAHPIIRVTFQPESGGEVDRTDQIDVRDYGVGKSFVFDKEAHWKLDLGTLKFKEPGKYKAVLLSGDEAEYRVEPACTVVFNLRLKE